MSSHQKISSRLVVFCGCFYIVWGGLCVISLPWLPARSIVVILILWQHQDLLVDNSYGFM